jgi:integrase
MPKDTRTRFTGVYARHKQDCGTERGGGCSCKPSYWGQVWDRAAGKYRKTKAFPKPSEAAHARADLQADLRSGRLPATDSLRVKRVIDAFLLAADQGVALNKHGRRYRASAVRDLRSSFDNHIEDALGSKRIGDVRRGDVQRLVDDLAPKLSGSRVRSVVSAIHSLYRYAMAREIVYHDPAALVQLPAMEATPRDRVVTPTELADLLAALTLADALPYGLAGYASARRAEIRYALVEDVDLKVGVVYLGADERGRKSRAAQRPFPIVGPLRTLIRRRLMERGRPSGAELLCPGHKPGGRNSGLLSFEALQTRTDERWREQRITAHECRHTCATWLDAAGVRPVVVSALMGHAAPARQAGAAQITQERYTHTLPGDLEDARERFERYLLSKAEAATS